ncbi:class II aldolase/adducin family protein, partial [Intestinimonas butyriciproducens]
SILGEALMVLGPVPCAPYARTGTPALSAAAGPLLDDHDAVLLANHGAVTLGPDLEQAYWRMETLEHTAQICLGVRLLGGGVPLTDEQCAQLRRS